MATPSLKIETWPIDRVINYARNSRMHSDDQVKSIAASITEFGFINPCLVDPDGVLIAGHGRVLAAKLLARKTVPVIKLGHLSEDQVKALRIADNQLPQLATWNVELLRAELMELSTAGYDMPLLGFGDVSLVQFMSGIDPDAADQLRQQGAGNLAEKFGIPPFSILNAREGWWQDRKRAWLAIGIQSELGRGAPTGGSPEPLSRLNAGEQSVMNQKKKANGSPGGSPRPAADYSNKARGDGAGKAIRRKPNAIPGGAPMPLDRARMAKANG